MAIDLARLRVEKAGIEITLDGMRQALGIADDAIAHAQRMLGRLDEAVDVLETLRLQDPQTREQRKNNQ